MSLAEFLLARIDEDEAAWRRMLGIVRGSGFPGGKIPDRVNYSSSTTVLPVPIIPAKLLAECEAKRRIVEEHKPSTEYPHQYCIVCQWDICCDAPKADYHRGAGEFPCPTLRLLALPYADHPDYQPEWRV
jgi:hypothetical protein